MYFNWPSLIFWMIFVIPMIAGLGWLIWQDDKRHRRSGLLILAVIVVVGIVYMYLKTRGL